MGEVLETGQGTAAVFYHENSINNAKRYVCTYKIMKINFKNILISNIPSCRAY